MDNLVWFEIVDRKPKKLTYVSSSLPSVSYRLLSTLHRKRPPAALSERTLRGRDK